MIFDGEYLGIGKLHQLYKESDSWAVAQDLSTSLKIY